LVRLRILMLGLLMLAVSMTAASAQSLVRDAEIESTLARIANPIFRAAGLNPAAVHIYIVNDRELNAFVAGGQNIFLFTGLLSRLETIDQLRAVIAHETGHIAGGHQYRRDQAMKGARGMALIGMVGAAAATMGGSPTAGLAIATGTRQAAERGLLAHSRGEEASADQAGLRYMAAAGSDPAATLEVLDLFRGQELLMPSRMDPYALTHPLWSERIALIEDRVAALPHGDGPDPTDVYWHARMVAKVTGFLKSAAEVHRRYPPGDTSEEAGLARSIAAHRRPDPARAATMADGLIALRPDDPFYLELKGQFLLEAGNAPGAVAA
jgi:predicted Zn-dependent protease